MILTIRPLTLADAESCDAIIRSLPAFFGHEGGIATCAQAVRSQPGWAAVVADRVVGFATWETRTLATAEITWMAVAPGLRHQGIGTAILEALIADVCARGLALALVMTAAEPRNRQAPQDVYAATRGFWLARVWLARGFLPLIELDIWDRNQALLLVRPLGA
jgi:GNAT superfamily N-acetyltransferase